MAERKYFNMKKDIHPDYRQVVFMDTTCLLYTSDAADD